jgi:hypothetical protein
VKKSISPSNARDFFLYLLAIIALYLNAWQLISLHFDIINYYFPDALEASYFYAPFESLRWSISVLFVVFPIYLGVTWFLRKDSIAHPEKLEMRVRKWLLYLTLFVAAVTIMGDLVTLMYTFLNGELTARFLLKVLVVLVVIGSIFSYYVWDLRREPKKKDQPAKLLAVLATIVALTSMIGGFFIIGSPAEQRMRRFDEQRVGNIQGIQSEVVSYWQNKGMLPKSLSDLRDNISGYTPPVDPETNQEFSYSVKGPLAFELCATFSLPSLDRENRFEKKLAFPIRDPYAENWNHDAGNTCFDRKIDPEIYKPFPTTP